MGTKEQMKEFVTEGGLYPHLETGKRRNMNAHESLSCVVLHRTLVIKHNLLSQELHCLLTE